MSIDGREIARRAERDQAVRRSPEASPVITVLAWLAVILPIGGLAWLTYVTGTWMGGGVVGGLLSVATTAGFCVLMWAWRRRRR